VLTVGALGCRSKVRGLVTRGHVADINTVSGGTGFSVVSMPDPEVRRAADGLQLTALLRPMHAPGRILADVHLGAVRLEPGEPAELLLPAAIGRVQTPPAGAPAPRDQAAVEARPIPSEVWLPYRIDLPGQEYRKCAMKLALPPGRQAILRLEALSDGNGRMVVAAIHAESALKEGR
jgi:hypothetical protein